MVTIAVDLMGSDLGPAELGKGVLAYLEQNSDVNFICFGDQEQLSFLKGNPRIEIVHTSQIVPMETSPLKFLRLKESSMYKALEAVSQGKAQGVVSAGSTGGFLTGSTMLLKNVPGVLRGGLCSFFPSKVKGKHPIVLDLGASNVNTAEELYGFARLGKVYDQVVMGIDNPVVCLLSNGAEEGKGLTEAVEAYKLIQADPSINFAGNCEAREVLDGKKDIIVTSGYPGNIFLKTTEGTALMMKDMMTKAFKRNLFSKIGYLLCRKGIKEMGEAMDYKKTGGAILLGINGVTVKTHGNSNSVFFTYSLGLAYRMIKADIVSHIREEFAKDAAVMSETK